MVRKLAAHMRAGRRGRFPRTGLGRHAVVSAGANV